MSDEYFSFFKIINQGCTNLSSRSTILKTVTSLAGSTRTVLKILSKITTNCLESCVYTQTKFTWLLLYVMHEQEHKGNWHHAKVLVPQYHDNKYPLTSLKYSFPIAQLSTSLSCYPLSFNVPKLCPIELFLIYV